MQRFLRHLFCAAILIGPAPAEETSALSGEPWQEKPISISTKQRDFRSGKTGNVYRIFIHVPSTPAPKEGFPVLYLLDGNVTYPLAALVLDSMLDRAPAHGITPGIIVGIGYPAEAGLDPARRTEDYTPPAPDLSATGDTSGHPQGGADRFLDFIETELKPRVSKDFPIDPARQTLFGHSYGGLFTLHTLFSRPGSFQGYFAASPSIWWNQRHILTEKASFLSGNNPAVSATRVRLSVGALEQSPSPQQQASQRSEQVIARRQVDNARDLARELGAAGLDADFLLFENENHGSARVPAINQAIRFAFGTPAEKPANR